MQDPTEARYSWLVLVDAEFPSLIVCADKCVAAISVHVGIEGSISGYEQFISLELAVDILQLEVPRTTSS